MNDPFPNQDSIACGGYGQWIAKHREQHRKWFDLFRRIVSLCHSVRQNLSWNASDRQQLFVISLYLRSISLFEGVYVLAEKGLMAESRILSRSLLELSFILGAALKDRTFADGYVSSWNVRERKLRTQALPHLEQGGAAESVARISAQLRECEAASEGVNELKIEAISHLAGLHQLYETEYRALCRNTHIGLHDLDQYLVREEANRVTAFQWGPSDNHFEFSVKQPMHTMLQVVAAFFHSQQIDESTEWKRLAEELVALSPSAQTPASY